MNELQIKYKNKMVTAYTYKQLAEVLGVQPSSIRSMYAQGQLSDYERIELTDRIKVFVKKNTSTEGE